MSRVQLHGWVESARTHEHLVPLLAMLFDKIELLLNGQLDSTNSLRFVSAVQTGNGALQNIAHGLSVVPAQVLVSVQDNSGATGFVVTEGAHDATNVKVTVTNLVKYKVVAWG